MLETYNFRILSSREGYNIMNNVVVDKASLKLVKRHGLGNVDSTAASIAISELSKSGFEVVVAENDVIAQDIYKELSYTSSKNVYWLPDSGILPYDTESTPIDRASLIALAIYKLIEADENTVIVTAADNLIQKIPKDITLDGIAKVIDKNNINLDRLTSILIGLEYQSVDDEIIDKGTYFIGPKTIDIYPFGESSPFRIYLEEKRIVEIDPLTLESRNEIDSVLLIKRHLIDWNDSIAKSFRFAYKSEFYEHLDNDFYNELLANKRPSNISFLHPLLKDEFSEIAEFIVSANIFDVNNAISSITLKDKWERYKDLESHNSNVIESDKVWADPVSVSKSLQSNQITSVSKNENENSLKIVDMGFSRKTGIDDTIEMIEAPIKKAKKTLITLSSESRVSQIEFIFMLMDEDIELLESWNDFNNRTSGSYMVVSPLRNGFYAEQSGVLIIDDTALFGQQMVDSAQDKRSMSFDVIKDLKGLKKGDPLVHEKFGIGIFDSIVHLGDGETSKDYIRINYAEDTSALVPFDDLYMVNRYGGIDAADLEINKMADDSWKSAIDKARENALNTAKGLLKDFEVRKSCVGNAFKKPNKSYNEFCAGFPYRETKDQLSAIQDVIDDMTSSTPMDRTVCGDVGFGKTEVAMRAAFLAVQSGFQVMVLVPTTVLSNQHYKNFLDRFEEMGKSVIELAGKVTAPQERKLLRMIQSGEADVIIGTQRLLSVDVSWKNTGLMIIDEEHRFGVEDKERIKRKRNKLDSLALTATPIPRTMAIGLHGMRGFSVISTPPAKRLSVRTIKADFDSQRINEGITRELKRNGQVFVLHNNTKTIQSKCDQLRMKYPSASVEFIHGKMKDSEIAVKMNLFAKGEIDILVATTIIEIGIDIPNANTIVIEDAQSMGLSQLHQLRGRVGRSDRQAYCYLVTRHKMNKLQSDRIDAVKNTSRLGEGFALAYYDAEIRGAGDLLGTSQSGNIRKIGFNLYMRLLAQALDIVDPAEMKKPSSKRSSSKSQIEMAKYLAEREIEDSLLCEIDIEDQKATITTDMLPSDSLRMSFYKKVLDCKDENEVVEAFNYLEDRFGSLGKTEQTMKKIMVARLPLRSKGMKKLRIGKGYSEIILENAVKTDIFENNFLKQKFTTGVSLERYSMNGVKLCTSTEHNMDEWLNIVTQ